MLDSTPDDWKTYVLILSMFIGLRWGVVVRFCDIGGTVYHHYLNTMFMIIRNNGTEYA